jgi:hypothetical protein
MCARNATDHVTSVVGRDGIDENTRLLQPSHERRRPGGREWRIAMKMQAFWDIASPVVVPRGSPIRWR